AWDALADEYAERGRRNWAAEPSWGIFKIPEADVRLLPSDLAGKDVIDLGCGTGYVSGWLARRGARPVGIDNSPRQLATARALQAVFGLRFPRIRGGAEPRPLQHGVLRLAFS